MIMKPTSLNNKISAKSDCGGGMDGGGGYKHHETIFLWRWIKKKTAWMAHIEKTGGRLPALGVGVGGGGREMGESRGRGGGWRACHYTLSVATTVTEQSLLPLYNMKAECTLSYNLNTSSSKAFLYNLSHIRGILNIKSQLL